VANIKQQKKRILVARRQRLENLHATSTIKTYFRRLQVAVDAGEAEAIGVEHAMLVKLLDRAGASRVMHPNTAARRKSRAAAIVARGPQEAKAKRRRPAAKKK
jgi:small subunit ribosomal protein S20